VPKWTVVAGEITTCGYEEVKDCPLYHVAEERCSSTAMSDARKRNIRMTTVDPLEDEHDAVPLRHRSA
jgi:hypothetical protein